MHVVRHIVDRDEFLPLMGDDAGDVFLQFIVPVHRDEALASLHRKDDLDIDLRVGVGHFAGGLA